MKELHEYRDPWLFEKAEEVIGFYPREFYCLDNFSSFMVNYNGLIYPTAEHAYQASKFMKPDNELVKQIQECFSAHEAQKIAQVNKDKQRSDWDEVKLSIMEELLRLKLDQNPYVKKKLLQTVGREIVEDSPKDSYWGWGKERDGLNQLGKLWMKLREELIEERK